LRWIVYILENFRRTFANLVAPPIDIATNRLVRCKALLFQMLKTASKLIHNWRCYPSSKCCKINQKHGSELGVLLWRHLTLQRKTVIRVHNYTLLSCTTLNCHNAILENLRSVCLSNRVNMFVPSHFLDYLHEV